MQHKDGLGPLEMKVLSLIHPDERVNVGELQKRLLRDNEELAYTTVMTVLSRLFAKGFLARDKEGRSFIYSRSKKTQNKAESVLNRIQQAIFNKGKLTPILALLDSPGSLSKEELQELRKKVNEKLKSMKD